MKRFSDSSVLFLWILSLLMICFTLQPYVRAEETKPPGPDFQDGTWKEAFTQEGWGSIYLTAVNYEKRNSESTKLEVGAELYYLSELVIKTWGVIFHKHEFDYENVQYAIKQENGDWKIGKQGKDWEIVEEKEKIWFFVTTESGLKEGRGFPKGDFGELPEDLPEMEID